MSYTPHTWVDNETITASKLNNIEEGIAEAAQSGGGGVAWIRINSAGYGGSHQTGAVYYARETATNEYELCYPFIENYFSFREAPVVLALPIPEEDSGLSILYLADVGSGVDITVSGDISGNTVDAYYPANSTSYSGYLITGSCTINLTAI